MTGKYEPLEIFLRNVPREKAVISLSFARIEKILGDSLPKSAFTHRPWWANQRSSKNHPQANSWLSTGFQVEAVQQSSKTGSVEFRRAR